MIKFFLTLVFFISTVFSFSQNKLNNYIELAKTHLKNKNYDACIELCDRIVFFDTLNNDATLLNIILADAYNGNGDYRNAALKYNQAYFTEKNIEKKNEIIFKSALNYYLSGDTVFAYAEMYSIDENSLNENQRDKFNLIMAALDYKTCRYESSLLHFNKIISLDGYKKSLIAEQFKKIKKINRRYNPTKVEWMSIVPGLGQLWCGYYRESLNAFLLISACYGVLLNITFKYDIIDGILVVYPWFNRYYKGEIIKSYRLAEKKRETERNKILNSIFKIIPEMNI
ncbi:MAG: hypothetical protein IT243_05135 [Bacteroidia bacterium]|nr:hypothetical protein [Bacteroidia bacterium]